MRLPILSTSKFIGVVLTVLGLAGMLTGGTVALYQFDETQNLLHLALGIAAFIAAEEGALFSRWYLVVTGILFGFFAADGYIFDGSTIELFSLSQEESVLYAIIAAIALSHGLSGKNLKKHLGL